jgi:hypothetical protein
MKIENFYKKTPMLSLTVDLSILQVRVVTGRSQVYSKNSTTLGGARYIIKKHETSFTQLIKHTLLISP